MKKFLLLALCLFFWTIILKAQVIDRDSTKEERFVANVLKQFRSEGIWVFVKIDSLYLLKDNYEVVHPDIIYKAYEQGYTRYDAQRFLLDAFINLTTPHLKIYERYPDKFQIKGIKVNMRMYRKLSSLPIDEILATYFNEDKTFKKQYCNRLHEVIAVCYTKQVQVITPNEGCAYYVEFE